jgi:hypothetical protein
MVQDLINNTAEHAVTALQLRLRALQTGLRRMGFHGQWPSCAQLAVAGDGSMLPAGAAQC